MAGVETAVGLALGIFPLLISAAEHYDTSLRPFARYRNIAREADRYLARLENQRVIFKNQCRILLERVIDHDAATSMLKGGAAHPLWSNVELDNQLSELLSDSKRACMATIGMIEEQLWGVEKESQDLENAIEKDARKSADPVGSKSWRQYITKKLRFSFSKPRLEHLLISLRELNDDFRTLSAQTSTLHSPELQKKSDYVRTSRWEVEKYKVIGRASKQVYEALGNACTKHTEHQAHFCVEVEQAIIQGESGAQVKFNMAYTHLQLAGNLHDDSELMWFVVDSTSGNIIKEGTAANITTCKQSFASTLKRQLGSTSCDTHKKIKKSVRFHTEPAPTASLVPNIPCAVVEDATIPDDCLRKDFCDLLRRRFRDQPQATECLGVLQAGAQCKNFVYPSSQKKCRRSGQAVTLGQMISKMGKGQYGDGIPLYDRLRLAKTLAVAVLQYHSTPWLKLSWRSEDVYFFEDGTASTHESPSLPSPHLNVRMGGACSQLSRASGFPCHSLARNPLLFSLGVVLLEIAYTSSLHNLQKPLDMESSREPQYTEFFAARRLAKSARTDMGIRYHKVVEKLIECDFGCSSDLNDPHLQAAFHTEVICPLERLEQKLHEFHFD